MRVLGIIPARYASSRFPGKPLVNIGGKSMIRRVHEQASKSKLLQQVIVATDDHRIFDEVISFSGQVVLSKETHQNGTERCAEVLRQFAGQYDYAINIQCDEPFMKPEMIDQLIDLLDGQVELATLITPRSNEREPNDNSTVKVVFNNQNEAMYFSRSHIPSSNDPARHPFYQHIGIYAYRADTLLAISQLPMGSLEKMESLEQLRWLENGLKIKVFITDYKSISIDKPEDLQLANEYLAR